MPDEKPKKGCKHRKIDKGTSDNALIKVCRECGKTLEVLCKHCYKPISKSHIDGPIFFG